MRGQYNRQLLLVAAVVIGLLTLFLAGCNKNPPLESYARPQQDAPQWRTYTHPTTRLPVNCKKGEVVRGLYCVSSFRVESLGLMKITPVP